MRGRIFRKIVAIALGIQALGCATSPPDPRCLTQTGVFDVTAAPFHARGDGQVDDTDAVQRAIDAASPGGTVFFPPGTYAISASLVNTVGVRLSGANRNASILRMTRDEPYGISMASGLHVNGLTIRGNSTPSERAHAFNGGNTENAVIEDCIIEHWGAVAVLGANLSRGNVVRNNIVRHNAHEGVYFGTGSDENIIEGNHIHHCGKNGIDVNGSRNRIVNNIVHDIGKPGDSVDTVGIMAGNPQPNPATDNLIQGNVVYRCATHGIILWAVSQFTIVTGNTCYENAEYGIFLEKLGDDGLCANHVVAQNVCRSNGSYGIILEAAIDTIVDANQAIDNGQDGIAVDSTNGPAERNIVTANLCRGNARHGIHIGSGSRDTFLAANQLLANNSTGLHDSGEQTSIRRAGNSWNP